MEFATVLIDEDDRIEVRGPYPTVAVAAKELGIRVKDAKQLLKLGKTASMQDAEGRFLRVGIRPLIQETLR